MFCVDVGVLVPGCVMFCVDTGVSVRGCVFCMCICSMVGAVHKCAARGNVC